MLDIRPCSVADFFAHPDAPALLTEYAAEACIAGLPPPFPSESAYALLEQSGRMHVAASYEGERMTGFIVLLVSTNPHYSTTIGVVESYFVTADQRKGGAGMALRKWVEETAAAQAAVGLLISAPQGGKLAQVLDHDKSYHQTNCVFFRRLS